MPVRSEDPAASVYAPAYPPEVRAELVSLRSAVAERDLLLAELRHRVSNHFQLLASLVGLQARRLDGPARLALEDLAAQIHAIAAVHEQLRPSRGARLELGPYLVSLVDRLVESRPAPAPTVEVRVEPVSARSELAVPMGLLVTELVSNALQHAFPAGAGRVRVELRAPRAGRLHLRVEDDGVGLPPEVTAGGGGGVGLTIVRLLVDQLGGELCVQGRPGARFDLDLPEAP